MQRFDRITVDLKRMNGEPCIRHLRLTVRRVLEALATYPDRTELKREYPELEDEDIRQALAFAAASLDDKILPLPVSSAKQIKAGKLPSEFVYSHDAKLEAALEPVISKALAAVKSETAAELGRVFGERPTDRKMLSVATKSDLPGLIARMTVQQILNRYAASATNYAATHADDEDAADEDLIVDALHRLSDGSLSNVAAGAARDALREGRTAGIEEVIKEIPEDLQERLQWYRSAVLDENVCNPCRAADGHAISSPDVDLSAICEGGEDCRCLAVGRLMEKAT